MQKLIIIIYLNAQILHVIISYFWSFIIQKYYYILIYVKKFYSLINLQNIIKIIW